MNKTPRQQRGIARVKTAERTQVEMQFLSLDQWLDKDHRARIVWKYVESLDLSELYDQIKATDGHVGRNAIDPRILFALWLFATIDGCTSARRLAELTTRDIPYMWICGGVSVNYHRLSDFRVQHGDLLNRLMVDSIAVLLNQNLVTLETVAQDGMRVRANAGSASFRRESTLDKCLAQAKKHVEDLQADQERDPSGDNRRSQAAQERAAREQVERIEAAKVELEKLKESRKKNGHEKTSSEARASTTDPQARRMKMADGGFRPAYNVQFATDGDSRIIVGMDVVQAGGDQGQMPPMHEQLQEDYGVTPEKYLVDGGFSVNDDIAEVESRGTEVFGVLANEKKQLAEGKNPYAAKPKDKPQMATFRARMGTEEAKQTYSRRAGIAEFPNAECRNRGLHRFSVRGLIRVKAQTLWYVLSHNFMRMSNLEYLHAVMSK
jgi:transposase